MGMLGLVMVLGIEAMLFVSLFFAWISLLSNRIETLQATLEILQPYLQWMTLTLIPLVLGSLFIMFYKNFPRTISFLCGILGVIFLWGRITMVVEIAQIPHDKTSSIGLAIFYMLSSMICVHVALLTLCATLRATGIPFAKLDLLPYFWHFSTLISALIQALVFLTV
jgi:hypothetical protein